jgi:hypothetical protein
VIFKDIQESTTMKFKYMYNLMDELPLWKLFISQSPYWTSEYKAYIKCHDSTFPGDHWLGHNKHLIQAGPI